ALAGKIQNMIGGSADLGPSNKTVISDSDSFSPSNYAGRNIHFGVREHAMGAILNGMALYGGVIPYGGTFLVFTDYMRPAIRLAALMGIRPIYVFTHDSIGLGEDGPTHQPVEHLASLRAIPNLLVIRPADANEVSEAWKIALKEKKRPVALALTRQGVPTLDRTKYAPAEGASRGAYVLYETSENPELIIIATGSEVHIALQAAHKLEQDGKAVRVVSMPCMELFEEQDDDYKEKVLPKSIRKRVIIEAGVSFGWHQYAGDEGVIIGIDRFGASAPYKIIYEKFGLTADSVVEKARELLGK
ncbi:MAG: transketolase, partial [Methanobacteriota archaeon]